MTEPISVPQTFGARLRALRRERQVSQEALEHRAELPAGIIARIEAGSPGMVTDEEVLAIASALGVTATALLGLEEP
jgi:transcriptional regulator with XRE-family HTH domain